MEVGFSLHLRDTATIRVGGCTIGNDTGWGRGPRQRNRPAQTLTGSQGPGDRKVHPRPEAASSGAVADLGMGAALPSTHTHCLAHRPASHLPRPQLRTAHLKAKTEKQAYKNNRACLFQNQTERPGDAAQ